MTKPTETLIVWIAQGFGIGRIPFAPGTWGSIAGMGWLLLLLIPVASEFFFVFFLAALVISILLAVWICDEGAKRLAREDPPSIVLDEIVAVPVCFLFAPFSIHYQGSGLESYFARNIWLFATLVFALFRLFDIWKPWPIRQSQRLPGGWGIVMDDVLAAVYVNLVMLLAMFALR